MFINKSDKNETNIQRGISLNFFKFDPLIIFKNFKDFFVWRKLLVKRRKFFVSFHLDLLVMGLISMSFPISFHLIIVEGHRIVIIDLGEILYSFAPSQLIERIL